jgi:hypothetical protein
MVNRLFHGGGGQELYFKTPSKGSSGSLTILLELPEARLWTASAPK